MLALLMLAGGASAALLRGESVATEFRSWQLKHGKTYTTEEAALRLSIFAANVAKINAHNALDLGWTQGVNKWADLTGSEWRARVSSGRSRNKMAAAPAQSAVPRISGALPTSVNWTAAGGVTPVKDQAQCGSCWAFASVVAVEGDYAVNKGSLVSLSEEQIVQCDLNNGDGNDGCNGGDQLTALKWLAKQPGLCTETDYPYTSGGGTTGKCKSTCKPYLSIAAGVEVPLHNETALMESIAAYPLSLSVDASNDAVWQFYTGGVVSTKCSTCTQPGCLDHGVGGVGYGTDATGGDYWLVKNSWGTSWGERGYIRLARGAAFNPYGQCGVQIDNQYSTGASKL